MMVSKTLRVSPSGWLRAPIMNFRVAMQFLLIGLRPDRSLNYRSGRLSGVAPSHRGRVARSDQMWRDDTMPMQRGSRESSQCRDEAGRVESGHTKSHADHASHTGLSLQLLHRPRHRLHILRLEHLEHLPCETVTRLDCLGAVHAHDLFVLCCDAFLVPSRLP